MDKKYPINVCLQLESLQLAFIFRSNDFAVIKSIHMGMENASFHPISAVISVDSGR